MVAVPVKEWTVSVSNYFNHTHNYKISKSTISFEDAKSKAVLQCQKDLKYNNNKPDGCVVYKIKETYKKSWRYFGGTKTLPPKEKIVWDIEISKFKKSNTATTSSSSSTLTTGTSLSTDDKISKSKQICTELGFKANSEKFSDCALKIMALQFETGNKVSNSDGSTTQQIIVKQQDDFDVGDFFFGLQKIVDDNYRSSNNSSSTNCRIVQKHWGADMVCR